METNKGTPRSIDGAIENALEELLKEDAISIPGMCPKSLIVKVIREHVRDFVAQKAINFDQAKAEHFIELFQKVFAERPKGFLLALQWYQGAKHISDFDGKLFEDSGAKTVAELTGKPRCIVTEERPRVPIGNVLFRVNHDESLTLIETNYDCSD